MKKMEMNYIGRIETRTDEIGRGALADNDVFKDEYDNFYIQRGGFFTSNGVENFFLPASDFEAEGNILKLKSGLTTTKRKGVFSLKNSEYKMPEDKQELTPENLGLIESY